MLTMINKRLAMVLLISAMVMMPARLIQAQEYAAAFLDIPLGSRALSLGGQFSPIDNTDGTAFYWNPSAIAVMKGQLISTMYSSQFGTLGDPLSHYFHLGYSKKLSSSTGISVNWIRNSIGNIAFNGDAGIGNGVVDWAGIKSGQFNRGTFSNADDAVYLSVAKNLFDGVNLGWQYFSLPIELPIGASVKYIRQSFGGQDTLRFAGSGIGVDVGTMFKFKLGDFFGTDVLGFFTLGLTVRDVFNTPVSWNTVFRTKSAIQRSVLFSTSYQQDLPFFSSKLLFLFSRDSKYNGTTSAGVEYRYRNIVALRIGRYDSDLTLGAGLLLFKGFFIDYAFQNSRNLGNPHRLNLTVNLDELL
jgi:hypothetical protein